MDVEQTQASSTTQVELVRESANVESDGMLLYFSQASYEPGTSPLSLWVPVRCYKEERADCKSGNMHMGETEGEAPLDVFERYVNVSLYRGPFNDSCLKVDKAASPAFYRGVP